MRYPKRYETIYFFTFSTMKVIAFLAVLLSGIATVSAATTTVDPCDAPNACKPGGPTRAYNFTTKAYELYPQCFPWVYMSQFMGLASVSSAIENQNVCRSQRLKDFGF